MHKDIYKTVPKLAFGDLISQFKESATRINVF